ncbi:MAG: hypothetical protein IJ560_00270 [Alphaproteobacteria bacterium]|nr:hypothetical protein [Alphaproteobacteria bacterium]
MRILTILISIFITNSAIVTAMGDTYMTDHRRYIDDKEWSNAPYRHVLAIIDSKNTVYGTANMVNGKILTARHCIDGIKNPYFRAFDGTRFYGDMSGAIMGDYNIGNDDNPDGDWAVIPSRDDMHAFIEKNSVSVTDMPPGERNTELVGFGALKVMSDQEIVNFKRAYNEYLVDLRVNGKDNLHGPMIQNFIAAIDGNSIVDNTNRKYVYMNTDTSRTFRANIAKYAQKYNLDTNMFRDTARLKAGECRVNFTNSNLNHTPNTCQGWHGNSGGGLFSKIGNKWTLVGMLTRSISIIGGKNHAGHNGFVEPSAFIKHIKQ